MSEWKVTTLVDDDGHLNIFIENADGTAITRIHTGQGDGDGEQLALRFTTSEIEKNWLDKTTKLT